TGLFEFPDNTMTPGAYYVVAFKNGYMDSYMSMFKGDTGLNIYLNEGTMNVTGGADGGYIEMPYVAWTSPMDGMMGAPTDIYCSGDCATIGAGEMPIIVAFSKEMNENTINDGDASNAGSNIYLTPDGGNTRISGKVKYVYNSSTGINEARFYSETHNTLTAGTFYSIVVTQNVTDINGASMQGGAMSDGSFSNSFNTMMDNSNIWGEGWTDYYQEGGDNYGEGGYTGGGGDYGGMDFSGYGGGGMMMPPYVMGTTPQPGAFSVDKNTSVVIEFSEPMNASSITADSIKLYPVSSETNWTMGTVVPAAVTLDQATQRIVTLNPTNNLDLNAGNSGWYVLKIMGSVKSASGIWLGDPGSCGAANPDTYLASQSFYESDFQLNSDPDGDTGAPTVMGTYPSDDATGVDVGIAAIEIGFSEPMLPSTVNAQNITLKAGSSAVTGKVKYDPMANSAKYIPTNALLANTQYTLTISVSVRDLASVPFAAAHSITFRTGAADTTSPEILYANADDYSIAITFSEPMNTAKQTDANRWTSSVLNSANYYVKGLNGATPVAPYTVDNGEIQLSAVSGGSFNFEYDEGSNTVIIKGFDFFPVSGTHATDFQIYLDNVKDKSNNLISG
ncbi:MAG: Ig-like domain-containing protein, partial [Phycisphaerae bacterium]|nr:Ig-like domain-containing protein [Phycisphaerae bacterium]